MIGLVLGGKHVNLLDSNESNGKKALELVKESVSIVQFLKANSYFNHSISNAIMTC